MNQQEADPANRELVIIRRRPHAEGEAHHGGVWKIAYADFMTAMMAFFLVMWLINAANEETRAQVASYFNPVKLVDSRTSTKGLQDLDAGADGIITREPVVNRTKTDQSGKSEAAEKKITEEMLLRQPFAALEQIAGPADESGKAEERKVGALPEEAGRPGRLGGKAYLDPFDPQTWQRVEAKGETVAERPGTPALHDQAKLERPAEDPPGKQAEKPAEAEMEKPPPAQPAPAAKSDPKPSEVAMPSASPHEPKSDPSTAARDDKDAVKPRVAKQEAHAPNPEQDAKLIEKEIKNALGVKSPGASPKLEVRSTANGVLISLTDDATFGMFAIASAEPQAVLVSYLEKIGKILNERPGKIIIRGHTDGRPFRSDVYDNWRLSTARAHMAYYMLVRGGIDEKRVERIEGYADRELKIANDPEAAENRRIEILLEEGES
ncbi:MotB family protein [Nordella sp. HKS 07]|uniref:MotB family protein n=1 Tax=Nordella sp. HKS 07 TaxID=2712222 RepID=UPI0013E1D040|nr:MotB family protein [Nordella sp. HKS 07]QIG49896.1 MotB family protein [Nordella sp. HKS 07]